MFGRGYTRLIGSTTVPIVLDDLRCTGSETRLVSCRHRGIGVHNCRHTEDAGLQCGRVILFARTLQSEFQLQVQQWWSRKRRH